MQSKKKEEGRVGVIGRKVGGKIRGSKRRRMGEEEGGGGGGGGGGWVDEGR